LVLLIGGCTTGEGEEPIEESPRMAFASHRLFPETPPGFEVVPGGCNSYIGTRCADPQPWDRDGDGAPTEADCDDADPHRHPGNPESECNGIDEDCSGEDLCFPDADADGWRANHDCDDEDARRHPGNENILCNGIDDDCSGFDFCDRDGDGFSTPADCDDTSQTVHRFAREVECNGIDEDCDGQDLCPPPG
jgi:hypothetical protein